MFLCMTSPTQKLKIFKICKNLWIRQIVRVYMFLVMHDLAWIVESALQATLTQAARLPVIIVAALLPRR